MSKFPSLLILLASLLGLGACSSTGGSKIQTNVRSEPGLNFSKYRTYTFAPPPSTVAVIGHEGRATVQGALNAGLAARGITPSKTPDFVIVFHMTTADKTSVKEYNQWQFGWDKVKDYAGTGTGKTYAYGAFMGNEVAERQYTQGTLIVDFVDTQTKKMFWRGTSVGNVGTRQQNEAELSYGISQMLRSVPVL